MTRSKPVKTYRWQFVLLSILIASSVGALLSVFTHWMYPDTSQVVKLFPVSIFTVLGVYLGFKNWSL